MVGSLEAEIASAACGADVLVGAGNREGICEAQQFDDTSASAVSRGVRNIRASNYDHSGGCGLSCARDT
jgi:hypothetical protein